MSNYTNILLRNGYISALESERSATATADVASLGSILMNLEYYGYALSTDVYRILNTMSSDKLSRWWSSIELELKTITGDDRNIGDFVVYKNFPAEVLSKSEAEYWIPQLLMYWGFSKEYFTEAVVPRIGMEPSERKSIVLKLAGDNTIERIFNGLLASPARWKTDEQSDVLHLSKSVKEIDFSIISFKENLIVLAKNLIESGYTVKVKTATDVLRLGAGLSDGDISLREKVRFKSFNRKTRRFLVDLLESCKNLEEDVARRKGVWKRFLHQLHPGDYKNHAPTVCKIADALYNDRLVTFNSKVETLIANKDPEVLSLLESMPGEFSRRIVHMTNVFGDSAVDSFTKVIPKLKVSQIVSLRRFLKTTNSRDGRIFPPKGNWAKLKIGPPRLIEDNHVKKLSAAMGDILSKRVPKVSVLDIGTDNIKLPSNGSDVGKYTRGTVFNIPKDVKFIRTASYWKTSNTTAWFDNGWNFFDSKWKSLGACCWNSYRHGNNAAVFSGDPINSKEMQGRAAQLIDLYPDKLLKNGVRYAVWNILCFSKVKFGDTEDVFAALQWGNEPQHGNLFEPSRCQLAFKLDGDYYTKYVCVIDLQTREMIYIDANLKSDVYSSNRNGDILSEQMPRFMEYINSIPSVYDLFSESVDEESGEGYVIYTDKDILFEKEEKAYVFQQEGDNKYSTIDINKILSE